MAEHTILLEGIVGSTAYGLADEFSDIDTLGMFAYPTQSFWRLSQPRQTRNNPEGTKPDWVLHEAGKYASLAIKCNPTALELLWLPEYTVTSWAGRELVGIRSAFLFEKGVRNAYLGYASQQFHRIRSRGDNSFSADTRRRTAKHARHLWRLALQGAQLHRTGFLEILLDPDQARQCREFGERVEGGRLDVAEEHLAWAEGQFDKPGVLPAGPDIRCVEQWLHTLRNAALIPGNWFCHPESSADV